MQQKSDGLNEDKKYIGNSTHKIIVEAGFPRPYITELIFI